MTIGVSLVLSVVLAGHLCTDQVVVALSVTRALAWSYQKLVDGSPGNTLLLELRELLFQMRLNVSKCHTHRVSHL